MVLQVGTKVPSDLDVAFRIEHWVLVCCDCGVYGYSVPALLKALWLHSGAGPPQREFALDSKSCRGLC